MPLSKALYVPFYSSPPEVGRSVLTNYGPDCGYESCNSILPVKRAGGDHTTKNPPDQHIKAGIRKRMVKPQ